MTALVVKFKAQEVGTGGGVQARRKHREEDMKGGDDITSLVEGEEKESSRDDNGRHDEQHDAPEDNGDLKPKPIEL